ncbi:MAG TPA: type II secretion system F family protein [Steroidobacteraceae bacterium]|jgi:MSHA biogenesis protein MshG|nr:type II secretion system F family protein [Steroidobacteraceae bacterium]
MAVFAYTGRSSRGEAVRGSMEADSADAVAARLTQTGTIPIEIRSAAAAGGAGAGADLGDLGRRLGFGKPSTADLILFTRQMFTITKAGIPLLRGLRGISASTHNVVLRGALEDVLSSLEGGRELAVGFSRHPHIFTQLYVGVVAVGEATGTLESSFKRLGEYLGQEQDIQDRVKNAVRYPLIVMAAVAVAIGVITVFVIPKFAPLFQQLGDQIPLPTRIIIGTSSAARKYWHVGIALIALLVFIANRLVSTEKGRYRWHKLKLRIPVLGTLVHRAILARISRTLAVSLNAGMPMLQTLATIARSAGNDYMAERVQQLREAVERGEPLARAAAVGGLFPPLVLQMIAVGEETGELPDLLEEVAGFYEREVDYTVKNMSAAFEPVLILFVGFMVLVLALGVFLPMWDLIAKVGSGH